MRETFGAQVGSVSKRTGSGRRNCGLVVALATLTVIAAFSSACGGGKGGQVSLVRPSPTPTASGWQAQAQQLLHRYGLQATGDPKWVQRVKLDFHPNSMGPVLVADASQTIGLDLRAHAGQTASVFHVPVQAETADGPIFALFIVRQNEVIGAAVVYKATPGIMSLADRPPH